MASAYLIALGAGLVSGVLFASLIPHTLMALVLFYLAPLPIFLAALGWGPSAGLLAVLTGVLTALAATGGAPGAAYAVFVALPAFALCWLALRCRESPPGAREAFSGRPAIEWYPVGRLFAWTALLGGTLAALAIPLASGSLENYEGAVKPLFSQVFVRELDSGETGGLTREQVEAIATFFARRVVPAMLAALWVGAMMFNFWAAIRVTAVSGLLIRPEPDYAAMEFPRVMLTGAAVALAVSFTHGFPGVMADAFLGAFAFAYLILGLVVIKAITAGAGAAQPVLLGLLYISVFVLGWPALFVIPIGAAESFLKLRARALARTRTPRG